ncbi:hypothetical protein HK405_012670, partial [Cladochytrium tenue]
RHSAAVPAARLLAAATVGQQTIADPGQGRLRAPLKRPLDSPAMTTPPAFTTTALPGRDSAHSSAPAFVPSVGPAIPTATATVETKRVRPGPPADPNWSLGGGGRWHPASADPGAPSSVDIESTAALARALSWFAFPAKPAAATPTAPTAPRHRRPASWAGLSAPVPATDIISLLNDAVADTSGPASFQLVPEPNAGAGIAIDPVACPLCSSTRWRALPRGVGVGASSNNTNHGGGGGGGGALACAAAACGFVLASGPDAVSARFVVGSLGRATRAHAAGGCRARPRAAFRSHAEVGPLARLPLDAAVGGGGAAPAAFAAAVLVLDCARLLNSQ